MALDFEQVDFDSVEKTAEENDKNLIRSNMSEAIKVNPDQHANQLRVSKESGVPVPAINESVEQNLNLNKIDFNKITNDSPKTASYLADFDNAVVAQDDVEVMQAIENVFDFGKTFEGLGESISTGFSAQLRGALLVGVDRTPDKIKDLIPMMPGTAGMFMSPGEMQMMSYDMAKNMGITTDEELQQVKKESTDNLISELRTLGEKRQQLTPEDMNLLEEGVRSGIESLANMAPGFGLMLATGGRAAPLLTTIGAQTFGASYGDARVDGLSPNESAWYAGIDAAIEVGTEMLPTGTLETILTGQSKGLKKEALKFMIREMGTEQLATLGQSINAYAFDLDEQMNQAQSVSEMVNIQLRRQAVTAIATVVAGGAQVTAATSIRKTVEALTQSENRKETAGQVEQRKIDELNKNSTKSKLRERNKESFKQFVEQSDGENNTQVFIDGAQTSLYLQDKTAEEIEADPALKLLSEQAQEAARLGTDVQVPVADFAADIAGTDHYEMLRDSMTMSDETVAPFRQDQVKQETEAYVKTLMDEAQENTSEYVEAQEIYTSVRDQLVDTGQVNPANASIMAQIVPAWATAQARRQGKTVQQVYQDAGLVIEGPQTGERARLEGEMVLGQEVRSKRAEELGLTVTENALGKNYSNENATIAVMEGAEFAPRENSITEFVVAESERGKGEGRKILNDVLNLYDINTISAAASSAPSVALLYEKGFRPISDPNSTLEESIAQMEELSSVTMVVPVDAVPQRDTLGQPPVERRKAGSKARALYEDMTREELIAELLKHELTGIKGRKAFVVDVQDAKAVASIDADSLKWINDNLSPDHGDALLQAVADAIEAETEGAYHISGDEFYVLGDTVEEVQTAVDNAIEKLSTAVITATKPDGTTITLNGLNITYGVGDTKDVADQKLKKEKVEREKRGERAPRGEQPLGSIIRSPEGVDPESGVQGLAAETFEQPQQAIEQEKNLFVAHNLSAENIIHAAEVGGLAVPSLAVAKTGTGFEAFGEISLLADKQLLQDPSAKTFGADIYSPRYPSVVYEIDNKEYNKVVGPINEKLESLGIDIIRTDIESRGIQELFYDTGVRYEYLDSVDKAPKLKYRKKEKLPAALKKFKSTDQYNISRDPEFKEVAADYYREKAEARARAMAEAGKDADEAAEEGFAGNEYEYWLKDWNETFFNEEGDVRYRHLETLAYDVAQYNKPRQVDTYELDRQLSNKLKTPKAENEFKQWIEEKFDKVIDKEQIFQGFTPSGNRKYIAHNLDNVVKIMKKELRGGENFNYGVGTIRSGAAPQFKTIKQIQAARGKLTDKTTMDALKEETSNEFTDLVESMRPYYKYDGDGFGYLDAASQNLYEMARGKGLQDYENLPDEIRTDAAEFLAKLRDMPTEYFESKVQRAVTLEEFDTAVVPRGVRKDALQVLKDAGLTVKTYDPKAEGSRAAVIAKQKRLLFQPTSEPRQPRGYYDPANSVIRLTEAADLSTFLHEFAHFMYEMEVNGDTEMLQSINSWYKRNAADVAKEANGYLGDEFDALKQDYQGEHLPPGPDDARLDDVTKGGDIYPDDIYSSNGLRYYGNEMDQADRESMRVIQSVRGKPNASVTMYRAVPIFNKELKNELKKVNSILNYYGKWKFFPSDNEYFDDIYEHYNAEWKKEENDWTYDEFQSKMFDHLSDRSDELHDLTKDKTPINSGDWVTLSRTYAKEHGESALDGDYKIIQKKVKAKELFTNGDSINEFGYWKGGEQVFEQPTTPPTAKEGSITPDDVVAYLDNKTTGDRAKDSAIRRAVHEQFARGFETYLMEGKAPSIELRNAFRTFARWLVRIYQSLRGGLDVKLDDEMRQVFDRLIATEEQIQAAEARARVEPMFTDAAMAGMTEEEFAEYKKRQEKVKDVQTETLRDKIIKQLTRQTEAWWKEEKQDFIDEEVDALSEQQVYRARERLKASVSTKEFTEQINEINKNINELETQLEKITKENDTVGQYISRQGGLNREEFVRQGIDKDHFRDKQTVFGKPLFPKKGGMTPDELAENLNELNFRGGDLSANDALEIVLDMLMDDNAFINPDVTAEVDSIDREIDSLQIEKVDIERQSELANIKLDHATVKEMVGEEKTDKLGRKSVTIAPELRGMTAKGMQGVHPDEAAAFFGYSSGSELLHDLITAPAIKVQAEVNAEAAMVDLHGDILTDGTIQKEADEAVRNEERGKLILRELKILARGTNAPTIDRNTIKALAEERIGRLAFREIHPGKYRKAEINAAQEAARMLAEGNKEGAAAAKMRQVMNYYLGMAATNAKNDTMKIVDRMSRYSKKNVREAVQKAEGGYWDQIVKILNRFEFKKSATLKEVESINTWVKERMEIAGDGLVLSNAVLNESYVTHWKNIPFSDLQGVNDSVKNIEHVARYANKLTRMEEEIEFNKLVDRWTTSMDEKVKTRFKSQRTDVVEGRKWGRWAMAQMTKIPFMASWLDGGERAGISHQILVQPFTDAYNDEIKMWNEIGKPIMDLIENRSKEDRKRHNRKIFIPEIKDENNDGNLYGHQVVAAALNTGNQSNLKKMLLGEGWASPDVEAEITFDNTKLQSVLSYMTRSDWEMVQKIWDQMELLYPQLAEVHRRTTGLAPPKVESSPFNAAVGDEEISMKGGYYPVKYDPNRDTRAAQNEDKLNAETESMFSNGASIQASVNTGATNERTGYYAPIRLSLDVVPAHFQETIHYITHHDPVREVNRLTRDKRVAQMIKEKLGPEEYAQLRPWLNDIAKDGREAPTKMFWDSILQRLRFGVTLGTMGFKASTGIIQISGLSNTVAEVGLANVAQSSRMILGSVTSMQEAWNFAVENSKVLEHRTKTMDREIKNAMKRIEGKRGIKAAVQEASMKHIAYIQAYMVDLPSWHAAYMKGVKEWNDEARAFQYADWVIENVQGSGATKDMARIMRGQSETGRMFTMFMTFFSSLWNMERDLVKGAKSGLYSTSSVAAKAMFLFTIPVLFEMMMRGELGEPDQGDDDERLQLMLTKTAMFPTQSIPFIRDIVNATTGEFGYNISPLQSIIEQGTRTIPQVVERGFTDEEITKGQVKGATKFIGAAAGVPGVNQAWSTGEHLYDVMVDGEDFTMHQLLFGPERR